VFFPLANITMMVARPCGHRQRRTQARVGTSTRRVFIAICLLFLHYSFINISWHYRYKTRSKPPPRQLIGKILITASIPQW